MDFLISGGKEFCFSELFSNVCMREHLNYRLIWNTSRIIPKFNFCEMGEPPTETLKQYRRNPKQLATAIKF